MSIAWGSLVLLLMLLPGVLFFVGLYLPEQFTRETTERSALGQLAAVLLVSFLVHGAFFSVSRVACGTILPCIDVEGVLRILTLDRLDGAAAHQTALTISRYWPWIFVYILAAAAVGVLAGWLVGRLIVARRLRGLTQHTWVYDLSVGDNFTVGYVMTNVRQDDRILMYQGFLKAFGLQKDGRFAYIVLTDAARGYMKLGEGAPTTSDPQHWHRIGETPASTGPVIRSRLGAQRERSYFVIEGEDIANVVFDRLVFDYNVRVRELTRIINEAMAAVRAKAAANASSGTGDDA